MSRKREKSKAFWRWSIVGMMASVFSLFAVVAFNQPPATDHMTACRMDQKDPAHTIILIDQSDPFQKNDYGWVDSLVDEEARRLPKYGRLTVVTPNTADPFEPQQVFSACSTGAARSANPLFENPRMVEDAWRDSFRKPLGAAVNTVMKDKTAPSSPLAEALYSVFDRSDFRAENSSKRRVVIISDLMQNSKDFSFYRKGADYSSFQETKLGRFTFNAGGAEIIARIVPRQQYDLPLEDLKLFWKSYFSDANANFLALN